MSRSSGLCLIKYFNINNITTKRAELNGVFAGRHVKGNTNKYNTLLILLPGWWSGVLDPSFTRPLTIFSSYFSTDLTCLG
jgi:hypothetical protein